MTQKKMLKNDGEIKPLHEGMEKSGLKPEPTLQKPPDPPPPQPEKE